MFKKSFRLCSLGSQFFVRGGTLPAQRKTLVFNLNDEYGLRLMC